MYTDRRVNAMRARDKRLALALHHEEHTIVYDAPGQTDGSLGGNGGTAGIPSPYPNKVQNNIQLIRGKIIYT